MVLGRTRQLFQSRPMDSTYHQPKTLREEMMTGQSSQETEGRDRHFLERHYLAESSTGPADLEATWIQRLGDDDMTTKTTTTMVMMSAHESVPQVPFHCRSERTRTADKMATFRKHASLLQITQIGLEHSRFRDSVLSSQTTFLSLHQEMFSGVSSTFRWQDVDTGREWSRSP